MTIALLLIFLAGTMMGSFALPTKYITKWKFENIWLNYVFWAYVVIPWLFAWYLTPQIFQIYANTPICLVLILVIGGLFFGIGQMCFALAMDIIGIGLGFVINLGIGIGLGFALPLVIQYPEKICTPFGLATLIGATLAIIGLIISNYAGVLRDRYQNKGILRQAGVRKSYVFGVILGVIAGFSSASQNFIFSYTNEIQDLALQMGASSFTAANIIWPLYLSCGFIPYMSYMIYLHFKNNSFASYRQSNTSKYYLFALVMGLLWYGAMMIYCKASQLIGSLGPVIGWPMFLVAIIFSSSFWGWKYNEWKDCGKKAKNVMLSGLGFLMIAVIILGYGATL